jgi:hypothetical protein
LLEIYEELGVVKYEKAVFVGKTSFKTIKNQLDLRDSNPTVLPFPSRFDKFAEQFETGLRNAFAATSRK